MKARIMIIVTLALILSSCSPAQASPTAAPTSASVPQTDTPLPTSTSTPEPTATGTPVPNGPCDNPLVPLVTGNQWTYRVTGDKDPYLYDLKVGDREDIGNININVEMIDHTSGQDIQELVICDNGAIDNFPLYFMSMILSGYLKGILNTFKQSGQYAPDYPSFAQNDWKYNWQARYLTEQGIGIFDPKGGSSIIIGLNVPIDVAFETDGKYEPVTVPAGSFPRALVVSNTYTTHGTVTTSAFSTSGDVVIHTTQWYVPYVGLVRAQLDSASVSIIAGQENEMPFRNVLELTGFTPGK